MTSATDELRRMLDERGVEWDELVGHPVVVGTEWHDRDGCPCTALEHADDVPDGMLSVQANLAPEQAIEATLDGDLKAENGKLRELVRFMWLADYAGHFSTLPEHQEHQADVWRRMRELGVEV